MIRTGPNYSTQHSHIDSSPTLQLRHNVYVLFFLVLLTINSWENFYPKIMYVFVASNVPLLTILRNDDTHGCKEHPKLKFPLITAELLPPPPDPFNRNPSLGLTGPISRYLVFGFVYPSKVLMKWADDHKVGLGKKVRSRALGKFILRFLYLFFL